MAGADRSLDDAAAIPTRVGTVSAVSTVAPGLREITLAGLDDHRPLGPDDFMLVIVPRSPRELDGEVSFRAFWELPPDEAPAWAYYTVRRWHPEAGEIDLWFVLHDHDGALSGWARRAAPGDRVALWGPRRAYEPPDGTSAVLLVGDETSLGAFSAILEHAPAHVPVTVVVESDTGEPVVDLPARPVDTVRWVGREGCDRGTGSALVAAVSALELDGRGLYAYGAAESHEVTAVRRHLRTERGLPPEQVAMVAYWRRSG